MRSRDGNNSFSLSIFSLVIFLFFSTLLSANEYLISYRYLVKDATLYNETLNISKSMKSCTGKSTATLILESFDNKNLKEIISKNQNKFIDFIHIIGLQVVHNETTINAKNSSTTILTLKTTCFKVDFNDNFANITALK